MRSVVERSQRARVGMLWWIFWLLTYASAFVGCTNQAGRIVEAQKPGQATGAGATITGPANSATPSTQHAKRTTVYFPPAATPKPAPVAGVGSRDAENGAARATPQTALPAADAETGVSRPPPQPAPPAIAWQVEETDTQLGQHQEAAPLIKAAAFAAKWSSVQWVGVLCLAVGALGFGYGVTHKETGYPLVFAKVAGCGVLFLLVGDNPLWLLFLLLPLGFYALQKLGVLRPI